jgi:hypothetical protein
MCQERKLALRMRRGKMIGAMERHEIKTRAERSPKDLLDCLHLLQLEEGEAGCPTTERLQWKEFVCVV